MIWVRFADDNETTTEWPNASVLPEWAAKFVDTAYSAQGNYYEGAVSGYWYENSYGKFHVIGDVYYVTTDSTEAYFHRLAYQSGEVAARAAIETEAFNKLDASPYNVDFTRYDNWTFGEFNHYATPDNVLDMCWFMIRNLHNDVPSGQSRFDIGWAVLDCNSLTKDGILIKGYEYFFPGSGIGMFGNNVYRPLNSSLATVPSYPLVNIVAHEMSHYFFGYNHFGVGVRFPGTSSRLVSAMTPYAGGWTGHYCSYEKERLEWLTPTVVNSNTGSITLYDMATTFDTTVARAIKVPIPDTDQYFLIENRRWISPYESRRPMFGYQGSLKPGVLIYNIVSEDDYLTYTVEQKLDADGMFEWQLLYDGGGLSNDMIDKSHSDAFAGYAETQFLFIPGQGTETWEATYWPNISNPYGGGPYLKVTNWYSTSTATTDIHGDTLDVFGVGDVVSPWSNPGSHSWSETNGIFEETSLGFEILSFNSGNQSYALGVRMSDPEELSPSRPQDMKGYFHHPDDLDPNSYVKVVWTAIQEPDVISSGKILIYRRSKVLSESWSSWALIDSVSGTSSQYVDLSFPNAGPGSDSLQYKIRVKDSTSKLSVYSDIITMLINPAIIDKRVSEQNHVPSEFKVYANYPNPFNPSTSISYDLPEPAVVSLIAYDVLGRKVTELVNGTKEAGYHS
ncbi:MAG: hypothetical protein ABI623_05715, partial [bacterium]